MATRTRSSSLSPQRPSLLSDWLSPTRYCKLLRFNATSCEIARAKVNTTSHVPTHSSLTISIKPGASSWYHAFGGSWWLGKTQLSSNGPRRYVVRFLENDNTGLVPIFIPDCAYNTAVHVSCGSWCLHTRSQTSTLRCYI